MEIVELRMDNFAVCLISYATLCLNAFVADNQFEKTKPIRLFYRRERRGRGVY